MMGCCEFAIWVIGFNVASFVLFKLYMKLTAGWDRSPTCLVGKTAIVTGANAGIGYYTAQDFAKRGARVILACRDKTRAEEARKKMVEATGNPNIVVRILDLGKLSSVREFAKEINETEERLDILVNNAGLGGFEHTLTEDGLSLTMQTNHFGHFLLTHLLIDLLKKSAPSRVVVVSSQASRVAQLNMNDLNAFPTAFFGKSIDYANTKLCNILFANELARKLKGSGVAANSLHPGAVQTDFTRNFVQPYRSIVWAISKMTYKSTEEGAQTSIYVAVSKDIEGVTGGYFGDCAQLSMPQGGRDEGLAKKLWEKSEDFVKLTAAERRLL